LTHTVDLVDKHRAKLHRCVRMCLQTVKCYSSDCRLRRGFQPYARNARNARNTRFYARFTQATQGL